MFWSFTYNGFLNVVTNLSIIFCLKKKNVAEHIVKWKIIIILYNY